MNYLEWTHPMKLPSCANLREHWATRAKRMRQHHTIGLVATGAAASKVRNGYEVTTTRRWLPNPLPTPTKILVMLTRHGVRRLDSDNLASAFKGVRDGVAAAIGIDDGDPRITWMYEQDKCKRGEERVTCRISWVSVKAAPVLAEPATTPVSKAKSPVGTATRKRSAKGLKRMEVGK